MLLQLSRDRVPSLCNIAHRPVEPMEIDLLTKDTVRPHTDQLIIAPMTLFIVLHGMIGEIELIIFNHRSTRLQIVLPEIGDGHRLHQSRSDRDPFRATFIRKPDDSLDRRNLLAKPCFP